MILIEVYHVHKEEDNSVTASLRAVDDVTGKVLRKKNINATTKAIFKDRIRAFKVKIEEYDVERLSLKAMVQEAIDEVMAE